MPLGMDQQYDLSWEEQDKIRRRLEIKKRLKLEGIDRRYNPYLAMQKIVFSDPAITRYADIRKKGRAPGAPFGPKRYFFSIGLIVVPLTIMTYAVLWDRLPYLDKLNKGEIPLKDRWAKAKH